MMVIKNKDMKLEITVEHSNILDLLYHFISHIKTPFTFRQWHHKIDMN